MPAFRFAENDVVRVREPLPPEYRPGQRGWITGARVVQNEAELREIRLAVGTVLYGVRFEDGEWREVAEGLLEPAEDD